jgi:hypothetical protein
MRRKSTHVDPLSDAPTATTQDPTAGHALTAGQKHQAARIGYLQSETVQGLANNIASTVENVFGPEISSLSGPARWAVMHLVSLEFTGRRPAEPKAEAPSPWMDLRAGAPVLGTEVNCRVRIDGEARDRVATFIAPNSSAKDGWATVLVDEKTRRGRVYKPIGQDAIAT